MVSKWRHLSERERAIFINRIAFYNNVCSMKKNNKIYSFCGWSFFLSRFLIVVMCRRILLYKKNLHTRFFFSVFAGPFTRPRDNSYMFHRCLNLLWPKQIHLPTLAYTLHIYIHHIYMHRWNEFCKNELKWIDCYTDSECFSVFYT